MESIVLVIHLILALAIIGLVLIQRSEGGGLGIGGSGGMGSLAGVHSTANVLTRATAVCAGCFFITSLVLGILSGAHSKQASLLERLDESPAAAVQTLPADVEVPVAGDDAPVLRPAEEAAGEQVEGQEAPAVPVSE